MLQKYLGFEMWVIELSSRAKQRNILLCLSLLDFCAYKLSVLFSVQLKKITFQVDSTRESPRGGFLLLWAFCKKVEKPAQSQACFLARHWEQYGITNYGV